MENAGGMLIFVLTLALGGLGVVTGWRLFTKAGKPGWASLIPIYNLVVLTDIVQRPAWWVALLFVPVVNIFIYFQLSIDLAKSFGKSTAFGIGLGWPGLVFYQILAFGKAQYVGREAAPSLRAVPA